MVDKFLFKFFDFFLKDYATAHGFYKFLKDKVEFSRIKEINLEYFDFLIQNSKDYDLLKTNFILNADRDNKTNFILKDGELIAIYTIILDNGKIFQFIKRYYQNYEIRVGNFFEINDIPILSFKRRVIYKDKYFYECYNNKTAVVKERVHISEVVSGYKE
jgi:hypothetical protein